MHGFKVGGEMKVTVITGFSAIGYV